MLIVSDKSKSLFGNLPSAVSCNYKASNPLQPRLVRVLIVVKLGLVNQCVVVGMVLISIG
jgi:hypothetical protein